MSKKTPQKRCVDSELTGFSPVMLLKSPAEGQRNLTGAPRVARDVAADVHNNIQNWNGCHVKGANIVMEIGKILGDCLGELNPEVEKLTVELRSIVDNLQIFMNALEFLAGQMKALVDLQKQDKQPLFISLSVEQMSEIVSGIAEAYRLEFKRKEYILENIAFSRDKDELMFYACCWTYQEFISKHKVNFQLERLLIETGHRKIN